MLICYREEKCKTVQSKASNFYLFVKEDQVRELTIFPPDCFLQLTCMASYQLTLLLAPLTENP
ncbi:hypothetical protein T03_17497 [Trichinella britovi]|uniref:Uncharacterized protein n=1 Tax=Trichinella britovi TaxID=45882 RepID=A0A0V1DET2_TRIBR|nr:hypothetical protein T03_17497 [Trichinella britovi]